MEKEISEDSYCTTDEGEDKESEKGYESDTEDSKTNTDHIGMIEKIKNENIYKEILKVGTGKEKPIEIDNVVISIKCIINNEEIEVPELSLKEKEISLDKSDNVDFDDKIDLLPKINTNNNNNNYSYFLPKAIVLAIQTMRKGEVSKIFVKPNYIFKHFDKIKKNISPDNIYLNEDFRHKLKDHNSKLIFEVELHNFFICQNLMDRGEIKKKILRNGKSWKYARLPDIVYYNLSCYYDSKLIYERKNIRSELDTNNSLYEIERRIIQNVKIGELAEVHVKPLYMKDKNPEFLNYYLIDNTKDTVFICEIFNIEIYDYIFKPNVDKISKKRILIKGIGRDTPDRESLVSLKMMIKINSKVVFNNFETENLENWENYSSMITKYPQFRENLNRKFNINNLDDDEDLTRDSKIFDIVNSEFPNLKVFDLRLYSVPLVIRKVLIHMKRNEFCYIKTNYIDYLSCDSVELNKVKDNIEIYIQLYEFLHRPQFSELPNEHKFKELSEMKEIANLMFKEGKFLRASKIYGNINYRFNGGQVKLPSNDDYDLKFKEIRLSCHNNLASAKFKLNSFFTVYNVTSKILNEFDNQNLKAMYLHGKSCIGLKLYEQAIEVFKRLNNICGDNEEFKYSLKEAERLFNADIKKQKSMFKKMIFS